MGSIVLYDILIVVVAEYSGHCFIHHNPAAVAAAPACVSYLSDHEQGVVGLSIW